MAGDAIRVTARAALAWLLLASACGGASEESRAAEPIAPPRRTAAEDRALRALLIDLAERHLCEQLEGSFVALPDADAAQGAAGGASPAAGRLWIESCEAAREGEQMRMTLAGRGFTWVERTSPGPVGTSFTVRGHLRFQARIQLRGEIDLAYADERKRVSLWLTPGSAADARVTPLGAVPVEPDGGWSSFIGAVGGVFGPSIEERARPMVEEQGSAQMSERLTRGFTFTADLCSGQLDTIVGALGNGEVPERPWPPDGSRWLANQRVRLRAGGLDVAGPFEASGVPLHVDLEVERGEGIDVRAVCEADGQRVVGAFLTGGEAPEARAAATQSVQRGTRVFIEVDTATCPMLLLVRPRGTAPVVYRYRALPRGAAADPLVRCE